MGVIWYKSWSNKYHQLNALRFATAQDWIINQPFDGKKISKKLQEQVATKDKLKVLQYVIIDG